MIRSDGIYIKEPLEIINGRARDYKSSFLFPAYFFSNKGKVIRSTKHNHLTHLSDFSKSDFGMQNDTIRNFFIKENGILIPAIHSFEKDVTIDIKSSEELYFSFYKKTLFFVSWQEIENSKGVFLLEFLNRFDRDQLEKRYE